jgi:hypothetical protein
VQDDAGDTFLPNWQLKCIFAVIGLLNFVAALDATSISVSLPVTVYLCPFYKMTELYANILCVLQAISDDLGGTATKAFWAGTSFLATYCVCQSMFSLSSDILGRKVALWVAVIAFTPLSSQLVFLTLSSRCWLVDPS